MFPRLLLPHCTVLHKMLRFPVLSVPRMLLCILNSAVEDVTILFVGVEQDPAALCAHVAWILE